MLRFLVFLHFFCEFAFRVPFNTNTYLGFYIELGLQIFTVHFYMLIFSSMVSLFYTFQKFIDALVMDYFAAANELNTLLDHVGKNRTRQKRDASKATPEIQRFIRNSIELHAGILKYIIDYDS